MNCMNCGAVVQNTDVCQECGFDLGVKRKSFQLSVLYYNQGLEKAEIRDLSGAIDLLKRSLKFNKLNIPARNLLGLVYFETELQQHPHCPLYNISMPCCTSLLSD